MPRHFDRRPVKKSRKGIYIPIILALLIINSYLLYMALNVEVSADTSPQERDQYIARSEVFEMRPDESVSITDTTEDVRATAEGFMEAKKIDDYDLAKIYITSSYARNNSAYDFSKNGDIMSYSVEDIDYVGADTYRAIVSVATKTKTSDWTLILVKESSKYLVNSYSN